MSCDILGAEVLGSLPPTRLMTYLSESGWYLRRRTETAYVYRKDLPASWQEVTVPNSIGYSDYAQMVYLVLVTLSKLESRPMEDIAADILSGNVSKSLQYRLMMEDKSGTVPLDWIIQVLQANKKMSASAYMDLVEYHPYHKTVAKGNHALQGMRMGQTSYGSYVVKILYPFQSEPQRTVEGKYAADDVIRRIVDKIMESSRAVVESAADGVQLDDGAEVSYNFVDSFLSLRGDGDHDLEMSGSGIVSDDRPPLYVSNSIFQRVELLADEMKPAPMDQYRVFSGRLYAAKEIEYDEGITRFTLEYFDDDGTEKASLVLDGGDRKAAMESLRDHTLVSLRGKLTGYGSRKIIEDVKDLHTVS